MSIEDAHREIERRKKRAALLLGAASGALAILVDGLRSGYRMIREASQLTAQPMEDLLGDVEDTAKRIDALRGRLVARGELLLGKEED